MKMKNWENLGHTGAGSDGNFDGAIVSHWRNVSDGTEYLSVDNNDGGSTPEDGSATWFRIDGTQLVQVPSDPRST